MRVQEKSTGQMGEVTMVGKTEVKVYFGHANKVRFERFISRSNLEPLAEPVYFGDGAKKGKVYDPEAFDGRREA